MRKILIKAQWFTTLALLASPAMACQWSAEQLVGAYTATEQAGFFETFALEADGSFQSWLHERPELSGKWQLDEQCVLTISSDTMDNPFTLTLQSLTDSSAEFTEEGQPSRYQRLSN
ncbi:hypothetical protein L9G74_01780 [Shewanella sp. C32]|uniref:Uncharacterized protein n=1 Tax=Shewanella electrica TaxID=515560 RepID=A0ABT2FFY9_9GAMM|nr:hypothetical protein [Shewanella electrica]MCH1925334.1 hypothetical protein [Shewanella electrica]MCS4555159.1 hypothetical protein [Shewanella electrica]